MTQPTQMALFEKQDRTLAEGDETPFEDPAFASNKVAPIHRWVPWIAGFSADFVRSALARHLKSRSVVLDPFAGVGTTLVEAVLQGHDAVGFEINPYAALACQTKLEAHRLNDSSVRKALSSFTRFYGKAVANGYSPQSSQPKGFKTRSDFYSPSVLKKVLIVQDFILSLDDPLLRNLFRLAFASTMVSYSNYSYEPSLGRRSAAGKPDVEDFAVGETIAAKLSDMLLDADWAKKRVGETCPEAEVHNDSFFNCQAHMHEGEADLLVTSPPYLNNYHYNRNTRPHLYWLGFAASPQDLKRLEDMNFGKYWQTVREKESVPLDSSLAGTEVAECVATLREKRPDKGTYGGKGWANYATCYFNDCNRFAESMRYALKPGGTALVVIGNSIVQGVMIPTDQYLAIIAEKAGLEPVQIHVPRATRIGNSIIQSSVRVAKAKKSHQLYESVVELRNPSSA